MLDNPLSRPSNPSRGAFLLTTGETAPAGVTITTTEGLGTPAPYHRTPDASDTCPGYPSLHRTSGQIMSAVALLKEPCGPDDAALKELMSANICHCRAYANLVAAIPQV